MRSPDRGHTSCLPSEIFRDRFNYIAQIMSKYPDLFPWYLLSIESSVNSENTAARGQTNHVPLHSTITHFPDARDRKLRITPYKKSCKIGMTKPAGHRDDEAVQFTDDAPPLVTIMARRLDPPIIQKLLLWKKHPFSPEFVDCVNLRIPMHREEKQGHFWPCQLWSLIPSSSLNVKGRECILV